MTEIFFRLPRIIGTWPSFPFDPIIYFPFLLLAIYYILHNIFFHLNLKIFIINSISILSFYLYFQINFSVASFKRLTNQAIIQQFIQAYLMQQIIMNNSDQIQEFNDCFEIELNFKKVTQIIFLQSSTLLICHLPNQYTIIEVININQTIFVKNGTLPMHAESLKRISADKIGFVLMNQFHIYDIYQDRSVQIYSLATSGIYTEQFFWEKIDKQQEKIILFYKTSILKTIPLCIYYDIQVLSYKQELKKLKKFRVNYEDIRGVGYCCGQIITYQKAGYTIEINFLQSNISHKINSIFNLYLIQMSIKNDELQLNFTHDELDNQLSSYKISKQKVVKQERKARNIQSHVTHNENKSRSLVYKNCFNRRKKDHPIGIFRVKASKSAKYAHLLERVLEKDVGISFRQMVIDLLV